MVSGLFILFPDENGTGLEINLTISETYQKFQLLIRIKKKNNKVL